MILFANPLNTRCSALTDIAQQTLALSSLGTFKVTGCAGANREGL